MQAFRPVSDVKLLMRYRCLHYFWFLSISHQKEVSCVWFSDRLSRGCPPTRVNHLTPGISFIFVYRNYGRDARSLVSNLFERKPGAQAFTSGLEWTKCFFCDKILQVSAPPGTPRTRENNSLCLKWEWGAPDSWIYFPFHNLKLTWPPQRRTREFFFW